MSDGAWSGAWSGVWGEVWDAVRKRRRVLGTGVSFGTFGELLQGILPGGVDFLVTLPINRYAQAYFISDPESPILRVYPAHKWKARRLAWSLLERLELPAGGVLRIESELPEGKGLASSSADLVAAARAIASWFDLEIPRRLLLEVMGAVEPSDGVMFDGSVVFHHRRVELREFLGPLPPLTIVAIDEGGLVDTVEFNKIVKPFDEADRVEYAGLLTAISTAVRDLDLDTIGHVATRSSLLNQKLRPKRTLDRVIALCRRLDGLGTVVAHSGTYVGILLSPSSARFAEQYETACRLMRREFGAVSVFHSLVFEEAEGQGVA